MSLDWDSVRNRPRYYDRDGKPLTLRQWARLLETNDEYRIVRQTEVPGIGSVSTVWLGLDHNYSPHPEARPLIFETMGFGLPVDREPESELERRLWGARVQYRPELFCERYSTEKEARAGHARALRKLRQLSKQVAAAIPKGGPAGLLETNGKEANNQ